MATEEYTPSIPSSTRHSYRVCQQDQETYEEYSESNVMYDGKYVLTKPIKKALPDCYWCATFGSLFLIWNKYNVGQWQQTSFIDLIQRENWEMFLFNLNGSIVVSFKLIF